jgi:hypothetical protein
MVWRAEQQPLICPGERLHRPIKQEGAEICEHMLGDSIRQIPDRQHIRLLWANTRAQFHTMIGQQTAAVIVLTCQPNVT